MNAVLNDPISFFFQAEDGIRCRSPSRGLGVVYKSQAVLHRITVTVYSPADLPGGGVFIAFLHPVRSSCDLASGIVLVYCTLEEVLYRLCT